MFKNIPESDDDDFEVQDLLEPPYKTFLSVGQGIKSEKVSNDVSKINH
jgi:hypothetical protein